MESVLLFKPDFFMNVYKNGFHGWMDMAQGLGLYYHFLLIFVGLLVCYYGFKLYKWVIIAFGGFAGGIIGLMVVEALNKSGSASVDPVVVSTAYAAWDVVGLILGAVVGGVLFWALSWVALFALAFVGCFFIGFFATMTIAPGAPSVIVGLILGSFGGVLVIKLFKPFMIVLTGMLGALDFAMGVAGILVATGVLTIFTGDDAAGLWAFLFPFILMTILGITNQVLDNYPKQVVPEEPVPNEEQPAPATP